MYYSGVSGGKNWLHNVWGLDEAKGITIIMSEIEILTSENAISITKPNKTVVDYYLFDEFEVHKCIIPSHSVQDWHMHEVIEEVIVVTVGTITVRWKEKELVRKQRLTKDTVLRVKNSIHNIENCSDMNAEFVVFRMVPMGDSKSEVIKNDKVLFNPC